MKKIKKIIISLLSLSLCLIIFSSCKKNNANENAIALVDGEAIDKEMFDKELEFYLTFYSKKYGDSYLENKNSKGKTNKDLLRDDLLDSMIKDQVMLNDLAKKKIEIDDNTANKIRSDMEKELGDKNSLKANMKALNISEGDFSDVIFNDSIRKIHYDYFLTHNKIKDSEILEYYKANDDLHILYKYNVLVFDNKDGAEKTKASIKNQVDFREALKNPVRNYKIINSDFVYKDDPLLVESKMNEKDKISEIFEHDGKYMILMINSYNENENELLMHTKDKYLKDAYEQYLNKLVKSSKIKVFIWKCLILLNLLCIINLRVKQNTCWFIGGNMNKSELLNSISEKSGLKKVESEKALNAFLETVEEALVAGDKVQLVGFGTFEVRDRKAREGRNPRKPEEVIQIPASKAPVFKAGKTLKEAVNK